MDFQFWVTNETLGISKEIVKSLGRQNVVNFQQEFDFFKTFISPVTGERDIDILDPTLKKLIEISEVDLIISTNTLTSEQAEENKQSAITRNIAGILNLATISKDLGIPIIHIEYPTSYSDDVYNMTTYCNNSIRNMFKFMNIPHVIVKPPIIYGDFVDNPISRVLTSDEYSVNIDPEKKKPFLHVHDFIKHLNLIIEDVKKFDNLVSIPPSEILSFEEIIDNIYNENGSVNFIFNDKNDLDPTPEYVLKWGLKNKYTIKKWLRSKNE